MIRWLSSLTDRKKEKREGEIYREKDRKKKRKVRGDVWIYERLGEGVFWLGGQGRRARGAQPKSGQIMELIKNLILHHHSSKMETLTDRKQTEKNICFISFT